MSIRIVPAAREHARAIAEVHVASSRAAYAGIVAQQTIDKLSVEARTESWIDHLSGPAPGTCCFLAVDDSGTTVGFADGGPTRSDLLPTDGELYAIYLYQESQRQGIGTALLLRVAEELESTGFRSMGLWVLEANPARQFYESLGGRMAAEKEVERDGLRMKELGYAWPLPMPRL